MKESLGFAGAALAVLTEAGVPLHSTEITSRALAAGLLETSGQTPHETMNAILAVRIKKKGDASQFVRTAPSTFGLREWVVAGKVAEYTAAEEKSEVRVPHFPRYAEVRAVLPVWVGRRREAITGLYNTLTGLAGTKKDPVDWTDPGTWIDQRLAGDPRELATAIWKAGVNPRYQLGHWLLASGYGLLDDAVDGSLVLTPAGHDFVGHPDGATVRELDASEGLLRVLALVAERGPARSSAFLDAWVEHLDVVSNVRSDSFRRSTLIDRLTNLQHRQLVERAGNSWSVTMAGLAWLREADVERAPGGVSAEQEILELLNRHDTAIREQIMALLLEMAPYAFEQLVGHLLEEMGYSDVEVTKPSNDKGVDVVANIRVGITSVREVVQVKRVQGSVHRTVLDQLRGSLHRWAAFRGTIITTGTFSEGTKKAAFEVGAAPIQLIDGSELVRLLIDQGVGVKRKELVLFELVPSAFEGDDG